MAIQIGTDSSAIKFKPGINNYGKITNTDTLCLKHLPRKRTYQSLCQSGHDYMLARIRTERFKGRVVNRCFYF